MGQNQWYHFGVGAPPILELILVVGLGCSPGVRFGFRPMAISAKQICQEICDKDWGYAYHLERWFHRLLLEHLPATLTNEAESADFVYVPHCAMNVYLAWKQEGVAVFEGTPKARGLPFGFSFNQSQEGYPQKTDKSRSQVSQFLQVLAWLCAESRPAPGLNPLEPPGRWKLHQAQMPLRPCSIEQRERWTTPGSRLVSFCASRLRVVDLARISREHRTLRPRFPSEFELWVWVKIKQPGDGRFECLVPFGRATHFG